MFIEANALLPPAPVHLVAERLANGDLAIGWVRRSRAGWQWLSGVDTALGEEAEAYRLTIASAGAARTVMTDGPSYVLSAAAQAAGGMTGALQITVVQTGRGGSSRPTTIHVQGE